MKRQRTPVSYYGGKQVLSSLILKLIPEHSVYVEPFCGGSAILFAKPPSAFECINDMNGHVVNFYEVIKTDFDLLRLLIARTPASRKVHRESAYVLKNPEYFNPVRRAWAFWVQCNLSFTSKIFGGYAYAIKKNSCTKKLHNKRLQFNQKVKYRLDLVDVENIDALELIKRRDTSDTFFYIDPPYFNSEMGHYKGYTEKDFESLLKLLETIKGKFLLSSYASEVLEKYTLINAWQTRTKRLIITASKLRDKTKVEVLTANYDIEE